MAEESKIQQNSLLAGSFRERSQPPALHRTGSTARSADMLKTDLSRRKAVDGRPNTRKKKPDSVLPEHSNTSFAMHLIDALIYARFRSNLYDRISVSR